MKKQSRSNFVFTPHAIPAVPVRGGDQQFAVRRIFCVGRNYAAHAREMGFSDKEMPFFFTKPADALVMTGSTIPFPLLTDDLNHEIELVLAIGGGGVNIPREEAARHIFGAAVGIDLTRRDLQIAHREKGRPWDWGKAFDRSAPITPITPVDDLPQKLKFFEEGRIWLAVNGEKRQDANLNDLIWGIEDIIAFCSQSVELKSGDLIYTGTPEGVGPLLPGDVITGGIDGLDEIEITLSTHRVGGSAKSQGQS
jgi:fumarylpyruvate hydrolase